jgi:hypothetical protein
MIIGEIAFLEGWIWIILGMCLFLPCFSKSLCFRSGFFVVLGYVLWGLLIKGLFRSKEVGWFVCVVLESWVFCVIWLFLG